MAESIFRGVRPGEADVPPRYNVVSPRKSGVLDVTILGHDVLGVPTHWALCPVMKRYRSHLCEGGKEQCLMCGVEPRQPLYFVAAYDHDTRARIVLRMGEQGAKALDAVQKEAGRLRGLRVHLADVMGKNGRVIHCTTSRAEPLKPLAEPHHIDGIVCRLLKIATLPGWLTRREMVGWGVDGSDRPEGGA